MKKVLLGWQYVGALFLVSQIIGTSAHASPSGLNWIPTADTAGRLDPVLQGYSLVGQTQTPQHWYGFKLGSSFVRENSPAPRFEVGIDGRYGLGAADSLGPALFQAKLAHQPWQGGPAICMGTANLAVSPELRRNAGNPFSYLIFTQSVGVFRTHFGYAAQTRANTVLLGADRDVPVSGKPLTIRGDLIQIQNQSQWQGSLGLMYPFSPAVVGESWGTVPIRAGGPSVMLKLNIIPGALL